MLGGQEAHEIGDVGRVQVFQQRAQPEAVAGVGGVHDLLDEGGGQHIVLVEGDVFVFNLGGDGQGGVCDLAHAWPPLFSDQLFAEFRHCRIARGRRVESVSRP